MLGVKERVKWIELTEISSVPYLTYLHISSHDYECFYNCIMWTVSSFFSFFCQLHRSNNKQRGNSNHKRQATITEHSSRINKTHPYCITSQTWPTQKQGQASSDRSWPRDIWKYTTASFTAKGCWNWYQRRCLRAFYERNARSFVRRETKNWFYV